VPCAEAGTEAGLKFGFNFSAPNFSVFSPRRDCKSATVLLQHFKILHLFPTQTFPNRSPQPAAAFAATSSILLVHATVEVGVAATQRHVAARHKRQQTSKSAADEISARVHLRKLGGWLDGICDLERASVCKANTKTG
jgi:hypothetical protein